jgi:hypothetical protein
MATSYILYLSKAVLDDQVAHGNAVRNVAKLVDRIAGLRWANVDLNAKTVRVVENRVAVGAEIMSGTPKSKASTRTLPMPDERCRSR